MGHKGPHQDRPAHFPYVVFQVCSAKTDERSFSTSSPKHKMLHDTKNLGDLFLCEKISLTKCGLGRVVRKCILVFFNKLVLK